MTRSLSRQAISRLVISQRADSILRRTKLAPLGLASVGLLCGGLLLLTGCAQENPQPDNVTPAGSMAKHAPSLATRVEVARIESTDAQLQLRLPGEVEAWRDANLAAPLGGYVEQVKVSSGQRVRKGQVLALVDAATHGARVNQARVEVIAARIEYKRAKKLGDALPGAQLDAARARYKAAKAALAVAQVPASRAVITAPFAGTLAKVDIEVGEVAQPGGPIMRLVQLDPVKVTVSLSDRDIASVRKGMEASVSTEASGTILKGTVRHIEPAADMRTRAFLAEIEVPNPDGTLLPGMIASVRISGDKSTDEQLTISQDWLVTRPGTLGVFLHEQGKAAWRDIVVGDVIGNQVVVKSGLSRGDELVIVGHRELATGDAIWVTRKGVCCRAGRVSFDNNSDEAPGSASGEPANSADKPATSPTPGKAAKRE